MGEVVIGEREGWEEGKNGRNVIGERGRKAKVLLKRIQCDERKVCKKEAT